MNQNIRYSKEKLQHYIRHELRKNNPKVGHILWQMKQVFDAHIWIM